jgi:glycine/D-amino acid oxidase-like deaminating enzyme
MKSTWISTIKIPHSLPSLREDVVADVVVIGSGLAGTLSAYLLAKEGKKVAVLEKRDFTYAMSAYTTAWLSSMIDTDLCDLKKMYGNQGTRKIWRSHHDAIDCIEKIATDENIDCEFQRIPQFRYATTQKEMERLKEEHVVATELGFETNLHDENFLPFPNHGSMEIKNQAKFHPLKFLIGLREAAIKYGATFYENTEVEELKDVPAEDRILAIARHGSVKADYSITATYEPFDKPKELFAHKGHYLTYVVEANILKGTLPEGTYESEENPYHYLRVDSLEDRDRLIWGGEDHRKEFPVSDEKNFEVLIANLKKLLPQVSLDITKRWTGMIIETIDGLAYIGSYSKDNPKRLVATGFSGNGMTYSVISAMVLRDIVSGKENPYREIYHAGRKTRPFNFYKKAVDFSGEFVGYVKNLFE